MKPWQLALVLFLIPAIAFAAGIILMNRMAGPLKVREKPLNERFGYSVQDVRNFWASLDKANTLSVQERLLKYDLLFPILYGGALIISLLLARSELGLHSRWNLVVIVVGIAMVADWTENYFLLQLLQSYVNNSIIMPDLMVVAIASIATRLKFLGLLGSGGTLLVYICKILRA